VFARAAGWFEALEAVAADPMAIARSRLVIFPQVSVGQYRADFMVVCADVGNIRRTTPLSRLAFFIECDGRIGHAENVEQVRADRERERAIRTQTGLTILRFSGSEVMFRRNDVEAVIGAQVEALAALRECGSAVDRWADVILEAVANLSGHRALRAEYTTRNSQRSTVDPYDQDDPFGEDGFPKNVEQEAAWDPFLDLRVKVSRLRHAVADIRRRTPDYCHDDEFNGGPQPFSEVLAAVLAKIAVNIKSVGPD
jgi:very-short-patch-repair endonuclease